MNKFLEKKPGIPSVVPETGKDIVDKQEFGRSDLTYSSSVATPGPLSSVLHDLCLKRITDNIPGSHEELHVIFHRFGFKSSLEQMPCNAILSVELLGIHTIEPDHPPGEDPFGCLDKKVIVLCAHEAVGVTNPVHPLNHRFEKFQKQLAVAIVHKYVSL